MDSKGQISPSVSPSMCFSRGCVGRAGSEAEDARIISEDISESGRYLSHDNHNERTHRSPLTWIHRIV